MSVINQEIMASARRGSELKDRDLIVAALQLAESAERLAALLQAPVDPVQSGANVPIEIGSQRDFMCPDLYRATVSGSIDRVNGLLGLIEETTSIHDGAHDVAVSLEDSSERNGSSKQWGCRPHGDSLCMLQEVTAENNTVLHIAAEQGHVELVEKIIRRDHTLLMYENSRHETPLHLAARAGNHQIVSLIVSLAQESGIGAHEILTKRNKDGDTVLHEAARHGYDDVVQVLMSVAPALSAEVNNASMSPLYLAVARNSVGIVKELLQYSHSSAIGPNQQNALHAAVLQSQEIASMLLDWKDELANERDTSGSTPMHYAASNGNVTVVKNILDKVPLCVYIQDQEGSSPLHVAAQMAHYSALLCMIDHCPDSFELHDNQGRNFLHIVAQNGYGFNINLVSRSPDLKKIVNERDNEGNTPLHCASTNGFSKTISHLLRASKADSTLMNNAGKTALDHAVSISSFFLMAGATATLSAYGATFSPQRRDKMKSAWKDEMTKWIDRTSKNLIVVSVLIATIAFSAAFNVPGSYHDDGLANLRRKSQYKMFLILDTFAMSTSLSATVLLVLTKVANNRDSWYSSATIFGLSLLFLWISLCTMQLSFVQGCLTAELERFSKYSSYRG
ncbi:protein ACCELERATED CELL DEATH 6-like [Carex rostrata]